MTNSNRNFLFAYVFLVALPVCGLAGVLRAGRGLSAPPSIGGTWKITLAGSQTATLPCGKFLADNTQFTISQSGKMFTLSFPNSALSSISGRIEGNALLASLSPSPAAGRENGCGGQTITLRGVVDAKSSPRTLQGSLQAENCATCTAIEFRGIRDEQSKAKESH